MAKQQPSIVIDKLGTHLMQVTNNHTGQVSLKWNWDKLLEEVRAATTIPVTVTKEVAKGLKKKGIDVNAEVTAALAKEGLNAEIKVTTVKKTAKRSTTIVEVPNLTDAEAKEVVGKVKKAFAKKNIVAETEAKVKKTRAKATVNDQITDAVTAKKPAAKKKTPAKKSAK